MNVSTNITQLSTLKWHGVPSGISRCIECNVLTYASIHWYISFPLNEMCWLRCHILWLIYFRKSLTDWLTLISWCWAGRSQETSPSVEAAGGRTAHSNVWNSANGNHVFDTISFILVQPLPQAHPPQWRRHQLLWSQFSPILFRSLRSLCHQMAEARCRLEKEQPDTLPPSLRLWHNL